MAISFIGSTSEAALNGSDITLDLTVISGIAQNDIVIIGYAIGSSDDGDYNLVVNTPTDYNEVADLFADDTQDCQLGVFYKVQGATPDTDVVVEGFGNMNNSVTVIAMVFRGVDPTTPMDVTPTTATGIDSANANPPSINHNNPAGVWTVIVGAAGHNQGDGRSFTFPTGYTTNAVSLSANDSDDILLGMGYRSSGVSDPEDPGVMTFTGGADNVIFSWCGVTIALRPAVSNVNVNAESQTLNLTTFDADVNLNKNVSAQQEALQLTTFDATVKLNKNVQAGTKSLQLDTFPATVDTGSTPVNVLAESQTLNLTTFDADVNLNKNVQAGTKVLNLQTFDATVTLVRNVQPDPAALALETFAASVNAETHVFPGTVELALETFPANVARNKVVNAGTISLVLQTYPATVDGVPANVQISANVVEFLLQTFPANVEYFVPETGIIDNTTKITRLTKVN